MRLNIELDGSAVQGLAFFADTVLWSGGLTGETVSGRLMLDGISPDPCDKCPELTTLTVHDECARAIDARLEACADCGSRIAGRLELPVTAEFTDECGNTYTGEGCAVYEVSIPVTGMTDICGEVALSCSASALTVQATSPECVTYQLTLDVNAYLLRSRLVRLTLEQDDAATAAGPVIVQEGGFARGCRRPAVRYSAPAAQPVRSTQPGCTPDSLAAGAARSCGARNGESAQPTPCEAEQNDAAGIEVIGEDEYRTVVRMPIHRRRR